MIIYIDGTTHHFFCHHHTSAAAATTIIIIIIFSFSFSQQHASSNHVSLRWLKQAMVVRACMYSLSEALATWPIHFGSHMRPQSAISSHLDSIKCTRLHRDSVGGAKPRGRERESLALLVRTMARVNPTLPATKSMADIFVRT